MSIASRRVARLEARLRADMKYLNDRGLLVVTTSTKQVVMPRDTVHAVAEMVRALDKARAALPKDVLCRRVDK